MTLQVYIGWAAWITLLLIVLVRPVIDLFKLRFLGIILSKRKWFGLICGLLVIIHTVLFMTAFKVPWTFFLDLKYWNFSGGMAWGLVALIALIPLMLTSNKFSMIKLKKNWKRVQKLTYIFFIASGLHIYLIGGKWLYTLVPMAIWLVLWVLSFIKRRSITA